MSTGSKSLAFRRGTLERSAQPAALNFVIITNVIALSGLGQRPECAAESPPLAPRTIISRSETRR